MFYFGEVGNAFVVLVSLTSKYDLTSQLFVNTCKAYNLSLLENKKYVISCV
jgi:hypothetical protein